MSTLTKSIAEVCAVIIESIGIGIITFLAVYLLIYAVFQKFKGKPGEVIYRQMRQYLGRVILLGLEFLVAADIIHTVAVDLTFSTVGVWAIIVVIWTFLSFSLDVELKGRRPWQKEESTYFYHSSKIIRTAGCTRQLFVKSVSRAPLLKRAQVDYGLP
jgi:uncharacterized membrane protein